MDHTFLLISLIRNSMSHSFHNTSMLIFSCRVSSVLGVFLWFLGFFLHGGISQQPIHIVVFIFTMPFLSLSFLFLFIMGACYSFLYLSVRFPHFHSLFLGMLYVLFLYLTVRFLHFASHFLGVMYVISLLTFPPSI